MLLDVIGTLEAVIELAVSLAGNPSFFTVVKVLNNLGYRINIQQKQASSPRRSAVHARIKT